MPTDAGRGAPRPVARIFTSVPLSPGYASGFSPRWFHFLRALGQHCELEVVAVRGIWDSGNVPEEVFRPPLALRRFTLVDNPPAAASWLRRAAALGLKLVDTRRYGPELPGIGTGGRPPDLAVFFLHHVAHLAFRLPAEVPCVFVLEEAVAKVEIANWRARTRGHRLREWWRDRFDGLRLRRYARFISRCGRRGAVVAISDEEKQWFSRWIRADGITVINHALDVGEFRPLPGRADHDVAVFGDLGQPRNYQPTAELIRRAQQDDRYRHLRWLIVGKDPHPSLQGLAGDAVTVTGTVPDTRPWYARARVVVVPSRSGTGSKSTVLQAWGMQRPVVATPAGIRGLPAAAGSNLLLAHTDEEMLASVQQLLSDPATASRIALAGRETLLQHCDLERKAGAFARLCLDAMGPPAAVQA